jgi:hypothetical protein
VPGGLFLDGVGGPPRREFHLRPVGTEDELFLLDTAGIIPPGERATILLTRCLVDGADVTPVLTIGDREALLLHLRRITLGEKLECIVLCPADGCGERLEMPLQVDDLLVPPCVEARREFEIALDFTSAHYNVTFRLPTTGDLARISTEGRATSERGAIEVLERCVLLATRDYAPAAVSDLPAEVHAAVAAQMTERDPQAELELDLQCPACGLAFSIVFDAGTFFLQELDERASRLPYEVHTLAWHYHWSEQDILKMPASRRTRYLDLVAGEVARGSGL